MDYNNLDIPAKTKECIEQLVEGYKNILGDKLTGIYLHGSLVMGCFNPECSDVDILVMANSNLSVESKHKLLLLHFELWEKYHQIIELRITNNGVDSNFYYHEDLKSELLADESKLEIKNDPGLVSDLFAVKKLGVKLTGEDIDKTIPEISDQDFLKSILQDSDWSFNNIARGPDTGACEVPAYAVLNFCRVLGFIQTKQIFSKKTGAEWGMANLPEEFRAVIQEALNEYLKARSAKSVGCKELKDFAKYAKGVYSATN